MEALKLSSTLSVPLRVAAAFLGVFLVFSASPAHGATKILLVVAHPDDEYYFAATVYKLAVQLNAQVDELIITDGAGKAGPPAASLCR